MKMTTTKLFNGRARHSVRAVWDLPMIGAHGVRLSQNLRQNLNDFR
jgi:hypothetical protein